MRRATALPREREHPGSRPRPTAAGRPGAYARRMHTLWKYLRPQWRLGALALLLATISQVLALVDPIIFGKLIDEYATK